MMLLPNSDQSKTSSKHGVGKQAEKAWLHGKINVDPTAMEMRVENNKPTTHQSAGRGGIGLANLRKRLELLYPGRHSLRTEDQPDIYKVALQILFNRNGLPESPPVLP